MGLMVKHAHDMKCYIHNLHSMYVYVAHLLFHQMHTEQGSSGSPIFKTHITGELVLVALHRATVVIEDKWELNMATLIEHITEHIRLEGGAAVKR